MMPCTLLKLTSLLQLHIGVELTDRSLNDLHNLRSNNVSYAIHTLSSIWSTQYRLMEDHLKKLTQSC